MPGIERISIDETIRGRGAWRFYKSRMRWQTAHKLYRSIFNLQPGVEIIHCSKDDFLAGYDCALGIDVILGLANGTVATLQEKFLYTKFKTVTVEYMQNPHTGERGDWFNMKPQYYFVGYDRYHHDCFDKIARRDKEQLVMEASESGLCPTCKKAFTFQDWILLDWAAVQREVLPWKLKPNNEDGARANFRYLNFHLFPPQCIVAQGPRESQPPLFVPMQGQAADIQRSMSL